jgi:Skp family chaperone for outer membrane proteins
MMIAAIAVFMLTLSTFAQPRLSPQERVKALTERLSLTKDQAAQIEQIYVKAQDEMKKMNSDGQADRSEFRKKMNETQDQIAKLLDDKQKVEFQKMQDERRKGMQNRKPGNTPNSKAETQKKD